MLTGDQIKSLGLIQNDRASSYRAASYDVRIGRVIKPDGSLADFYSVPPQGIVEVVSEENMSIPSNISGIAMVKTSLCSEGLLALNIGIVDPGYHGKVASYLVNFGRKERSLKKGDVFLRFVFHELDRELENFQPPPLTSDSEYLTDKQANIQGTFGKEFLDIASVTETFAKKAFDTYKTKAFTYVAIAAFLLGLMTFCLNFGNLLLVQRFLQPSDTTKAELLKAALQGEVKGLTDQNQDLTTRLKQLDQVITARSQQLDNAVTRINELERAALSQKTPVPH